MSEKFLDYAKQVQSRILERYIYVDVDSSDRTLGKKLAEARNNYYNTILVVGEQEVNGGTVNLRVRGKDDTEVIKVDDVIDRFVQWKAEYK